MQVKRGDIYYADLSPVVGSEQGGIRPVLIVQNDVGNKPKPKNRSSHPYKNQFGKNRPSKGLDSSSRAGQNP